MKSFFTSLKNGSFSAKSVSSGLSSHARVYAQASHRYDPPELFSY
jgi:hypothetical protein